MRGADSGVDWAILVTGYEEGALTALGESALSADQLARHGSAAVSHGLYGLRYLASHAEL